MSSRPSVHQHQANPRNKVTSPRMPSKVLSACRSGHRCVGLSDREDQNLAFLRAVHASVVPTLVTITGPIAAGKNAAAEALARRCIASAQTVIIADVDDVAAMVVGSGAAAAGLWFAADEAHGALVAE